MSNSKFDKIKEFALSTLSVNNRKTVYLILGDFTVGRLKRISEYE